MIFVFGANRFAGVGHPGGPVGIIDGPTGLMQIGFELGLFVIFLL